MTEAQQHKADARATRAAGDLDHLEQQAAWHLDRAGLRGIGEEAYRYHLRSAEEIGQTLLAHKPTRARAHNLLGRLALDQGQFEIAADHLQQAARLAPHDAGVRFSLGHLALQQQRLADAAGEFRRAIEIDPLATVADQSLAYVHYRSGLYAEAFSDYRRLIRKYPNQWTLKTRLLECAARVRADYDDPALRDDMPELLQTPDLDHQALASVTGSLLIHRYHLTNPDSRIDLAALLSDDLLLEALHRLLFVHPEVEDLVASLRTTCLHHHLTLGRFDAPLLRLFSGLLRYGLHCEQVLPETEDEITTLDSLEQCCAELAAADDLPGLALPLALLALYRPLDDRSWLPPTERLESLWPEPLQPMIPALITNRHAELARAQEIPTLTPITDDTSAAVRLQYEENPYPRWEYLPRYAPTAYLPAVAGEVPAYRAPTGQQQPLDILVAGTGTGRHAVHLARHFFDTRVLAMDLSRRSLAYGQAMAEELTVEDIEFVQGDILQLHRLDRQFDVIECSGVLHHMADPLAGWQQLCARLRPGGLMKVGLYSTRARQIIHQLRDIIADQNLSATPHDIRRFRRSLLREADAPELATLVQSVDFYSMSGVRDLLFHVQEHTFTPAELAAMIESLPLEFLGFVLPASARRAYQHFFPDDPALNRLDNWETLERDNPTLFGGMYQLYLQKPLA
ncbi:methyltransferase domain-containing protein [Natronospirillum operosum]|uniref:Methyltransferase domain-containing protein n=1 Tax=Natronospirillum operosum TaxID=2759953 RepID=A0A4Z0WL72_9GAMM|nr:class I SAM-dependent methyltransferase [Natronospirillum operosum]TGG95985.1 methyltransferase domain-containing protein [Natronospirillum operosum]